MADAIRAINVARAYGEMAIPSVYAAEVAAAQRAVEILKNLRLANLRKIKLELVVKETPAIADDEQVLLDKRNWLCVLTGPVFNLVETRYGIYGVNVRNLGYKEVREIYDKSIEERRHRFEAVI